MDESRFVSSISGEVRFDTDGMYAYFQPNELPFNLQIGKDTIRQSREALMALSNLNGRVSGMDEERKNILLSTLVLKESVHSSSIEGTRSTIGDMYRSEKGSVDETARRDIEEINNYREALLCVSIILPVTLYYIPQGALTWKLTAMKKTSAFLKK